MGRRGTRPFEESGAGVMPLRVIAERIGVSERTVSSDWKSAQQKLKEIPGAFSILLETVQAVAISKEEILQCGSVECDREFIEKYSKTKHSKTTGSKK
jgi:hypothetical protein